MQPHAQAPHCFLNSAKRQEKLFFAYLGITFTNHGHVAKSLRRGPLDRCFFTSEGLQIRPMIRPPSRFSRLPVSHGYGSFQPTQGCWRFRTRKMTSTISRRSTHFFNRCRKFRRARRTGMLSGSSIWSCSVAQMPFHWKTERVAHAVQMGSARWHSQKCRVMGTTRTQR